MSIKQRAVSLYDSLYGIEKRPEQRDMVEFMASLIDEEKVGAVEAPTGTGKSLAVLTVAIAAWLEKGYKTVISTNTRVLQSQLFVKDLPLIKRAIDGRENLSELTAKTIYGRNGYVCRKKTEEISSLIEEKGVLLAPYGLIDRFRIMPFVQNARRSDSVTLPEEDPLKNFLSCESCIGKSCPYYQKGCAYYQSLRYSSEITIVNHAFVRTFLSKIDEESKLAPFKADVYFFDEAHHLMGYSTSGSREHFITRPVNLLTAPLPEIYEGLFQKKESYRKRLSFLFDRYFSRLENGFPFTVQVLREIKRLLEEWWKIISTVDDSVIREILIEEFFVAKSTLLEAVRIYNEIRNGGKLLLTPSECAVIGDEKQMNFIEDMKKINPKAKSFSFLSSTLSTGGDFSVFSAQAGVNLDKTITIPTILPWDRVLFWIPTGFPEPKKNEEGYKRAFAAFCAKYVPPFVKKDLGGVLILCSSIERLKLCANALSATIPEGHELFVQGELPKSMLAGRFLSRHSPVLVASNSFREGFDAPERKLTWVIMDRLPFTSPEDPEFNRTTKLLFKWGAIKSSFEHSFNMMEFSLRQGAGRLLRTKRDYGAITLFDPRIKRWEITLPIKEENTFTEIFPPQRWVEIFCERFENCKV